MAKKERIILGIDPGLANTGWGIVQQSASRLTCVAYGCVATTKNEELSRRLAKIHEQIDAVITKFHPECLGIETVWFGQNITAAFGTGQARGAALVACAQHGLSVGEFTPRQIKMAVVGTGAAEKAQVQYMVKKLLSLDHEPKPDHASDALAAAICYTTHEGFGGAGGASLQVAIEQRGHVMAGAGTGGAAGAAARKILEEGAR
jgi:crossover junction endodeoxyribonuclease RuvC